VPVDIRTMTTDEAFNKVTETLREHGYDVD
jgi:hypothetical protein